MSVSTHVLDTGSGTPAVGVPVRLDHYDAENWRLVREGETDPAGRWDLSSPLPGEEAADEAAEEDGGGAAGTRVAAEPPLLVPGTYRLRFGSGRYYAARDAESYYPEITVIFLVTGLGQRHHVPLALGPFGYSTYRGA
ncbi:hydroxyisourate hydrolase [Actinomadura harenae]|uniref:5-hydroxyisourate hydrolase n=1 Tax=Actinomadura harenae TaxID=2483351 RepID=A0A3M2LIQ5_9ACTN|nr:hydroxyisourate hydrolase [Actinomadura harenae]RMI35895.1 hydroxyisourate hydrolase [Actinomadura harenae]